MSVWALNAELQFQVRGGEQSSLSGVRSMCRRATAKNANQRTMGIEAKAETIKKLSTNFMSQTFESGLPS